MALHAGGANKDSTLINTTHGYLQVCELPELTSGPCIRNSNSHNSHFVVTHCFAIVPSLDIVYSLCLLAC